MARRSVLGVLLAGLLVIACVTVAPAGPTQPAVPDFSFAAPSIPPVVIPTLPPLPTEPPSAAPLKTEIPVPTDTTQPLDTTQPTTTQPTDTTQPTTTQPTDTTQPADTNAPAISPPASPIDISSLLTSTIGMVNLSDSTVSIDLDIYDSGSDQGKIASTEVTSFGSVFQNVLEATYSATFTGVAADPIKCVFDAHSGSEIDFTAVNGDVLVSVPGATPTTPDDLFVESSSLCKSSGG